MDKYIGTYRVLREKDLNGNTTEFTYIPCKYGITMYRYSKNKIALTFETSRSQNVIIPKIKDKVELFVEGDAEATYLFDEKYIHDIAKVVSARIKGKNIPPKPANKKIRKSRKKG